MDAQLPPVLALMNMPTTKTASNSPSAKTPLRTTCLEDSFSADFPSVGTVTTVDSTAWLSSVCDVTTSLSRGLMRDAATWIKSSIEKMKAIPTAISIKPNMARGPRAVENCFFARKNAIAKDQQTTEPTIRPNMIRPNTKRLNIWLGFKSSGFMA
jgi:hypothetical protein